jgi:eukaryotic-like serine/threonine-protein kinase
MNTISFFSPNCEELISSRYQIKQLIASGGMGEVFLAHDLLLGGLPVAIKFISHVVSDCEQHQEFANEARICAALSQRSIHIVKVTDYGVCNSGKPFYVMEYLEGKTLNELVPLSVDKFIHIARQICLGLQCAHEGIDINGQIYPLVHRDIKPANILVTSDLLFGELVKILDFGVAKFLHISAININHHGFQGTLAYCSPEQLEESEIDHRSDIYSLGVVMYEMLTGAKPWQPETDYFGAWYKAHRFEAPRKITSINPHLQIPQDLDNLIMACLAKNPDSRPQSLAEVIEVLENFKAKKTHSFPISTIHPTSGLNLSLEKACRKLTWSKDKPIQEIVFPHLVTTENATVAALSLMMPKQEIQNRKLADCYNQFVFVTAPYPMLLWVTLLYSQERGAKWLPCYLDMQNPHHLNLVRSLAASDRYALIFFTLESPHTCTEVSSSRIGLRQQQMLETWLKQTHTLPSVPISASYLSKKLLKQHYKLLQSRILKQLTSNSNYQAESVMVR